MPTKIYTSEYIAPNKNFYQNLACNSFSNTSFTVAAIEVNLLMLNSCLKKPKNILFPAYLQRKLYRYLLST